MAIIVPEIYAQMITEKRNGKVRISQNAVDITTLDDFAQEGDSITFPQFLVLGEAELLTKGSAISTEELKQNSIKKEVKHYAKGAEIYDIDAKTGHGSFIDNAQSQQAEIFARARDKEMVADIDANAVLKSATSTADTITEAELIAGLNMWGDDQDDSSFDAIVVNSKLLPSFYAMEGFINSQRTYVKDGNGKIVNGCIGHYRTIPVILTNVGTYDNSLNECKSYIIKKGALGKAEKKSLDIELDREAKYKRTNVLADEMFVVGLIQKDGACILRKTIA